MTTKNFTCYIIDDEPPAIRILEKFIKQLEVLSLIGTSNKSLEALSEIQEKKPDILFLDIQMPDLTGIQLSKLINYSPYIIFTTAYAQFAVEGFQVNAVDYLLKPIAFPRFIEAIEKVKERQQNNPSTTIRTISQDYFFVKTDGKNRFQKVALPDILYLESIKNYVVIHTKNEQIVTYSTLKSIQENLPENNFIKVHKSYIVALDKVEKTDNYEVWVNGKDLPLGDTYKNEFFEAIHKRKL
ncbi:LytR/AlgR family response regulator transcription factor [Zunongwangia pacifica]|uniref:LytTR family DNA-binding domain-containing protein n=1 Tax=Zunongwangia pacifica TaxID=2911062 RepID=A0A9X2A0K9_9FLAO|nr:LytTR family DNA-binding domain-containing protein [Zunongwangia pacifica]MCL6217969.1 LytTR family DNA-binding domain-containing protein [Zunongwangia pacifica]